MENRLFLFYRFTFWISLLSLIVVITDFGYEQIAIYQKQLHSFYFFVLGTSIIATLIRYIKDKSLIKRKAAYFDIMSVVFVLWLYYQYLFVGVPFETTQILDNPIWIRIAVLLTFIREFSELKINFLRTVVNPAQLFILSFLALIFLGSLLLILPNATYNGIGYLDALFTATSAVCVTGLIVVDTANDFTLLGQTFIMLLIQIGGLGILTFASYFSYFFSGASTYENQLALSDITSSKKLGEVFSILKNIILITLGIELTAGILIYISLDSGCFSNQFDMLFFSAFHSVSAFCNAGFSTLSQSLYDDSFRFNYGLQLVIIFTFVLGGLGFPIVVNVLKYLKYKFITTFSDQNNKYKPWVLNLNSRINLITTFTIILAASVLFYFFEFHHTLSDHNCIGKIVTALFGATTPRTAGFNTIDTAAMSIPTIMLVLLLMWIGASPQSTGGGIKTSTFAIATLNILSLAKGKTKIEVFRREIAPISVRRAFAIISLSLIVNGFAILLITFFDPEKQLIDIAFETFSAYSTVGLSLGITSQLSDISKIIIMFVMFVGRISMLSLVIAIFKKVKHKNYSYPQEEITIN